MEKICLWLKSHFLSISQANIYFFSLGKNFLSAQIYFVQADGRGISYISVIFSDLWGVVGIAYGSTVCDHSSGNKYKQSINEWRPTLAAAGQLIAHEMGHNLGN